MNRDAPASKRSAAATRRKRPAAKISRRHDTPKVLECLFEEHRYLKALVGVLADKTIKSKALEFGDYFLLRDIAGYLHDYPDQVHHPTEDLLCVKLEQRHPAMKKSTQRLRRDHHDILTQTGDLLELLDQAVEGGGQGVEKAVRSACETFVVHHREHMEFENRILFPAAMKSLQPSDWREIESHFAAVEDPLFGRAVGRKHRRLYEHLVSPVNEASERLNVSQIKSMEHLILASAAIVDGVDAWYARVRELREALFTEARATVSRSIQSRSLVAGSVLSLQYGVFVCGSNFRCASDLLRIWATTTREALPHCLVPCASATIGRTEERAEASRRRGIMSGDHAWRECTRIR